MDHCDDPARLAAQLCPDVLALLDSDFRARWVSPSVTEAYGFRPDEVIGYGVADLVHLDDLEVTFNSIAEADRRDGRHQAVEVRLRDATGRYVPTRICTTNFEQSGETGWVLSMRPVPDDDAVMARRARLQALVTETALACSELRWQDADHLDTMLDTLAAVLRAHQVTLWALQPQQSAPGEAGVELRRHRGGPGVASCSGLQDFVDSAASYAFRPDPTGSAASVEVALRGNIGSVGVLQLRFADVGGWDDAGADLVSVIGTLVLAADIRCQAERALLERSQTDALTGVWNPTGFKDHLADLLAATESSARGGVVLIFADLDRFKQLNDRRGHGAGDEVLVELGANLRRRARPGDMVGRVGGDEFVVAFAAQGRAFDEARVLEVRRNFTEALVGHGIDASLGVAHSRPGDSVVDLLHRADLAMYTEKARRRTEPREDAATSTTGDPDLLAVPVA